MEGAKQTMTLVIYGNPVPQGRPRFTSKGGFARAYDPAKSRDYKDYIRLAAAQQVSASGALCGALSLSVRVYRGIPKSLSKSKREAAERGELRPTTKPDITNYLKIIEDALNKIAWRDDSEIVDITGSKYYSERPRIEIEVEEIKSGVGK